MQILGREPVAWAGIIAAVAIAVIQTLAGQGVISDVTSGKALDAVNALSSVAVIVLPIILNYLARQKVTPTAAPVLPAGTPVTTPTGAAATVTAAQP